MKQKNLCPRSSECLLLNDDDVRPWLVAGSFLAGNSFANNRDHFFVCDFRLVTYSGSGLMEHFL